MKIKEHHHKYYAGAFFIIWLATITIAYFTLAANPDETKDTDKDGLTDYQEKAIFQTFYDNPDTDGDGFNDGIEVANDYSPKQPNKKMIEADTDNDGLNDKWEILLGTNLMIRDTDGDGYLDGTEVYQGFSPTNPQPEKVTKIIEVDIINFSLKYYMGDVMLDSFLVSTGKPSTPTPKGEFEVMDKYDIKHYYGYPNTPWNLKFTSQNGLNYYIHSAYWHDKFGQENLSGGCVNVPQEKMEYLYKWASNGTKVIIK